MKSMPRLPAYKTVPGSSPLRAEPVKVLSRGITLSNARLRILVQICHAFSRGKTLSLRELARIMGKGHNGVVGHLKALKEKGLVTWDKGQEGRVYEVRTLRPTCRITFFTDKPLPADGNEKAAEGR